MKLINEFFYLIINNSDTVVSLIKIQDYYFDTYVLVLFLKINVLKLFSCFNAVKVLDKY